MNRMKTGILILLIANILLTLVYLDKVEELETRVTNLEKMINE